MVGVNKVNKTSFKIRGAFGGHKHENMLIFQGTQNIHQHTFYHPLCLEEYIICIGYANEGLGKNFVRFPIVYTLYA